LVVRALRAGFAVALLCAAIVLLFPVTNTHAQMAPPVASPTPYPMATENPNYFNSDKYYYSADDNDPKLHPVPPEVQTGPHRDWHIRCLDWSRLPRSFKGKPSKRDWQYFVTTCECWSSMTLKY